MDYKKKYEEAERLYRTANADQRYVLESLFPKLRESEDERIRKELITHCRNTRCVTEEGAERIAKWIAWLEKQGGQNPQRMISAKAKEAMYNKPACAWSEEDEEMCQETIDWFEKKCFPYAIGEENPARESIKWLKSLKQRIGGEQ